MSITVTDVQPSQGLKNLFGRGMNSELYKLPADKQEMDRLSLQHRIWKLMAGGLYPKDAENVVQSVLRRAKRESRTPMILDIGSGSGAWAVEMALKFPQAKVVGMDLIQSCPSFVPTNCKFIKADATVVLAGYSGQFDIIQCRSVAKHVADPGALTHSIGRALRAGGLFFFADAVTAIFDEDLELYPLASTEGINDRHQVAKEHCSWFARWMAEVTERWTTKALQNTDGDKLHILIRRDGQFEDIHGSEYLSPIGWDGGDVVGDTNSSRVGELMVLNVFDFLEASKPSLLSSGLSKEAVEKWVKNVQKETVDPTKHGLMKWVITWATKSIDLSSRDRAEVS